MPKVSVVIPTYNRAQYLPQAIQSVLAQTFTDYEIVVVDDGSTDNTREVIKPFFGRIKYLTQENQGISRTRNRAILESKGRYIAFLDSDDYWTPEKLAEQVKVLDLNPKVGIVYVRMPIINDKGEQIGLKPAGVSGRNFQELLELWGDLPTSSVMVRRECFDKAGLFDPSLPPQEDIDMWIRISQFYDLYEIENKVLAYYRRHEDQITVNKIRSYQGFVNIFTKIYETYPQAPRELMLKRIAQNHYLLGREYYILGDYKKAFMNVRQAVQRYPRLGSLSFVPAEGIGGRLLKSVKPYGLLILSLIRSLFP
jgi:glycosyltransferase involved in cell wall biosynthesis